MECFFDFVLGWIRYSPANFVHKWSTPQLVIHGSKDYRLPETDGIGAFHALQESVFHLTFLYLLLILNYYFLRSCRQGIPSRLVIFPDENHWVLKPENSLLWHETVLDWINEHVGLEKYTEARERAKSGATSK